MISDEELAAEEALQKRLVDEAAKTGGVPRTWRKKEGMSKQFERVAERIEKAGGKLCQEMGLPERGMRCYYYFRLAYDKNINAHADGNEVVIYSGMMRFLQSDDELAAVMGHELAHNLMGHVDAQYNNAMGGLLMGAMLDGLAAAGGVGAGNSFSQIGGQIGMKSFSVGFEEEADYVGLYIASRAGYNIKAAPSIWRRFSVEDPSTLFVGYDHPSNAKRSVAMQKIIAEINDKRKRREPVVPDVKQ